jgi:hypothetical protein
MSLRSRTTCAVARTERLATLRTSTGTAGGAFAGDGGLTGHFELVGLAVGQVPYAVFQARLGDRLLEIVQR